MNEMLSVVVKDNAVLVACMSDFLLPSIDEWPGTHYPHEFYIVSFGAMGENNEVNFLCSIIR